jgi:hypothetical protein
VPIYSGGLDFSCPIGESFNDENGKSIIDTVINLTGFVLVARESGSQEGLESAEETERAVHVHCSPRVPVLQGVTVV